MDWFEDVAAHLENNLESFATHYFEKDATIKKNGKGYAVSHCPVCRTEFAFYVRPDYVKCFSCGVMHDGRLPSLIYIVKLLEGEQHYIGSLEAFTGIAYPKEESGLT